MKKQYGYWLVVWKRGDEEIHEPACFQVGIHPKEWADAILDRGNNTRDERASRYSSYDLYKLNVEAA